MSDMILLPVIEKILHLPIMAIRWGGGRDKAHDVAPCFRAFGCITAFLFCYVLSPVVIAVSEEWGVIGGDSIPPGICSYPAGFSEEDLGDSIVLAVAAPLKTEKGKEILRGTILRMEEFNRAREIPGKNIVLLKCDDGMDPRDAKSEEEIRKQRRWKEVANRIAESEALVVIGHRSSNASIAAGEVYKERRVPAITGTAQADEVTKGNPWYFRTISQASRYLENMVHYANKVLDYKRLSIIYIDSPLGRSLGGSFDRALKNHGIENVGIWRLPTQAIERDEDIPHIIRGLGARDPDVVFLAVDDENAIPILKAIKEKGVDIPILGSVNISKSSFPLLFKGLPKEEQKPGYYTDGILAPAYFMFDVAGRNADEFVNRYEERFPGYLADISAISTYDAAGLAIEAIKMTYINGDNKEERRTNIRNYISGLNKDTGNFYEGAMGKAFFDEDGNSITDVPIAFLSNREVISAPIQIAKIVDPKKLDFLERELANNRFDGTKDHIFKVTSENNTEFFNRVNAVYSGVKIKRISNIDAEELTYDLDVYLWFRFNEDPELDVISTEKQGEKPKEKYLGNIEFINALGDVEVIKEESIPPGDRVGELGYSLYRVKGRFRALFDPEFYAYGERTLELNFRHKKFPRERLIFVQDILSAYKQGKDPSDIKKLKQQILNPSAGWEIREITHHLDIMDTPTLGNPELFGKKSHEVEFSRHNSSIIIKRAGISIMGISPSNFLLHLMALILISTVLLFLEIKHRKYSKRSWFSNPIIYITSLIFAEIILVNWNSDSMNLSYLNFITKTMDILWWVVLGRVLGFAANIFIFAPLEGTTGRKIPTIIPRMTAFTIYLFMFFGVTAFVFDYEITSLLATSGLLAMIIGLAIQANLSNIFSGIAINLERPFRIGDWVKIGGFDEGKVINVTWRSVRIRTPDNRIISIPNSTAAETIAHNFTPAPEEERREEFGKSEDKKFVLGFTVHAYPEKDPEEVKKTLQGAVEKIANNNPGILLEPAPVIKFLGIREHSAGGYAGEYNIMVSIEDYEKKKAYIDDIWCEIWGRLNGAGCLHPAPAG
uniref:Branched-chain amino acid transport system substrate-binding protein n=1 Tax=Candidatus Kentrum sp. FW TaxID=2126338 RepID=A0A450SBW5_9GAMM|nr:MAG: branched-chain amino acid transport system substrate-binding protein [Candidatus Kentron sp. FW]VFJ52094.1 MAG: branched-chain amino acid transport system substrate-binding protein [Candidatus Kentron sp. FW]